MCTKSAWTYRSFVCANLIDPSARWRACTRRRWRRRRRRWRRRRTWARSRSGGARRRAGSGGARCGGARRGRARGAGRRRPCPSARLGGRRPRSPATRCCCCCCSSWRWRCCCSWSGCSTLLGSCKGVRWNWGAYLVWWGRLLNFGVRTVIWSWVFFSFTLEFVFVYKCNSNKFHSILYIIIFFINHIIY